MEYVNYSLKLHVTEEMPLARFLEMACLEAILRLDNNRKSWWIVASQSRNMRLGSKNFWPDVVS